MKMTLKQMLAAAIVFNLAAAISLWMINPWLVLAGLLARVGGNFGSRFWDIFQHEMKKSMEGKL